LNSVKPIDIKTCIKTSIRLKNEALNYELYENAITVLKNTNAVLPIKDLANQKIAYLKWRCNKQYILSTLKKYTEVTEIVDDNFENLQSKLNQFSTIGYHKSDIA
jgi:beta-glucosidase-like glycosyl hydrolase